MASPATPIVRTVAPEAGQGANTGIRIDQLKPVSGGAVNPSDLMEVSQGGFGRKATVAQVASAAVSGLLVAGQNITITNGGTIGVTNPISGGAPVVSGNGIDLRLQGGQTTDDVSGKGGGVVINGGTGGYYGGGIYINGATISALGSTVGQAGIVAISGGAGEYPNDVRIVGGAALGAHAAGDAHVLGGIGGTAPGGNVYIEAGSGGTIGGNIIIAPGGGTTVGHISLSNVGTVAGAAGTVYIDSATKALTVA